MPVSGIARVRMFMRFLLGVSCLLFSGCFQYDQIFTVRENGNFDYSLKMVFSSDHLFYFDIPLEDSSCQSEFFPVVSNKKITVRLVSAEIDKSNNINSFLICSYAISGNVKDSFSWRLHLTSEKASKPKNVLDNLFFDMSLQRQSLGVYKLASKQIVSPAQREDPYKKASVRSCSYKLAWSVEVPKIIRSNGIQLDKSKATWQVCSEDAQHGFPYTREFYVVFKLADSVWERLLQRISRLLG